MFTHTTSLWRKSSKLQRLLLFFCLVLISVFPIYRNLYYGLGKEQLTRHQQFLKGESLYFNPWQYRVLCPLLVEGGYKTVSAVLDPVLAKKLEGKKYNWETIKYYMVFFGFRLLLHLGIFLLAFELYSEYISNKALIAFGFLWLSYSMGNAVRSSDLSFNTYMDVLVYLLGIWMLVKKVPQIWFVPLMVIGAMNRETCLALIPIFFFWEHDWKNPFNLKGSKPWLPAVLSTLLFAVVYVGVRKIFGYRPPTVYYVPAGLQMLKLNLLSGMARYSYMEVIGTVSLLPIFLLLGWKYLNSTFRYLFWMIVPAWFAIHYISVVAWESRLFLVPVTVVLLPASLLIIEKYGKQESTKA